MELRRFRNYGSHKDSSLVAKFPFVLVQPDTVSSCRHGVSATIRRPSERRPRQAVIPCRGTRSQQLRLLEAMNGKPPSINKRNLLRNTMIGNPGSEVLSLTVTKQAQEFRRLAASPMIARVKPQPGRSPKPQGRGRPGPASVRRSAMTDRIIIIESGST